VSNGYHKMFACCNYAHAAVEATLDLRSRLQQRKVADIEEIVVEAGPGGLALTTVEPETVLAAKFSIPHAVAATTHLGTAGASAFTFDTLGDASIADLRRRVRLAPYADVGPPPRDRPARVLWKFRDGGEMSALCENPRGGADQPFDEPTLLSKLADNAGGLFPAAPKLLAGIIAGDPPLLSRTWRDVMADLVSH
jgi:2-methylcitrate dehydratase PrpD